jgi:hypothetical protein
MKLLILILFPFICLSQVRIGNRLIVNGTVYSTYIDGWFNYSDSTTSSTPITFTANDTIALTCDGQGRQTDSRFKPYGIIQLFDTTGTHDSFDFSELTEGDELTIRFNLEITTTAINQEFEIYLQCAIGWINSYKISNGTLSFKTIRTRQIGFPIPLYIGNNETNIYPTKLMFTSTDNALIKVNSFYISTKRRFF